MVPVMLGLTVFPLAAIGIAAYLVMSAGHYMTPVAGAILLLSCCILVAATVATVKLSRHEEWLWNQQDSLRSIAGKAEDAQARVAMLERQRLDDDQTERLDRVARDVASLRREMREFMEETREAQVQAMFQSKQRRAAAEAAAAAPAAEPAPAAPQQPVTKEQLTLLLEPVIELATGTTSHYRAQLGLADSRGNMVGHDELVLKAEQGGMRPALDVRMVRMVAPVLRRLRQRNPGLRIFVPMSRRTLGSQEEAGRILAILQRDADVAAGIVFEFAQAELGELDPKGIENLARLARSGATLALREVYLGGLDLSALSHLGVRYLSFPPHAVDAGSGPNQAWSDFAQQARTMQIQIMVGGVKTPEQATAVNRLARYGHGPFFAPPRKVRPDAGIGQPGARSSAAVA